MILKVTVQEVEGEDVLVSRSPTLRPDATATETSHTDCQYGFLSHRLQNHGMGV